MRLPRSVKLCGHTFKIRRLPKKGPNDGEFDVGKGTVSIRTGISRELMLETLLHELTECAMALTGCEYSRVTNDSDFLFIMDHQGMENVVAAVAGALYPIIKKGME